MSEVFFSKSLEIPEKYSGWRIDATLADLLPEFSRAQWSEWLKLDLITMPNTNKIKPKLKLTGGENIDIIIPKLVIQNNNLEPEKIALDIIFEDDNLIIINKPAGLIVHPGAGNPKHTLVNALLYHDKNLEYLPRAGLVHRLDKDTSGLLIIGKNLHAYTNLVKQMQNREIERRYYALTHGHIIAPGRIKTKFGRHPINRLKMAVCKEGREAITDYEILEQYNIATLLKVKLLTGRTHQIRVHMAHINHPIVGDGLYGGKRQNLIFNRQALHAYEIKLTHPILNKEMLFSAPIPDDLKILLGTLKNAINNSKLAGT